MKLREIMNLKKGDVIQSLVGGSLQYLVLVVKIDKETERLVGIEWDTQGKTFVRQWFSSDLFISKRFSLFKPGDFESIVKRVQAHSEDMELLHSWWSDKK